MISRDELRKARPNIETATTRYVEGQLTKAEYEKLVEQERRRDRQPAAEQTTRQR
jgi:hypothetical protein